MKRLLLTAAVVSSVLLAPLTVQAADPLSNQVKASAEMGYIATSGNTDNQTLIAKFSLEHNWSQWRNHFHVEALKTDAEGTTTAEKYTINDQLDYKFNEFDYLFVQSEYENDEFSGFEYTAKIAAGYGRRILNNDTHLLDVEVGPSNRFFKVDADGASDDDELLGRLNANYLYNFSEFANFTQKVEYETGEDNSLAKSVSAVKAQLNGRLALKVSYTVKYTEEVPAETDDTDTETAVTLVYTFK
jgi:putative salt-induced outer membrane protein